MAYGQTGTGKTYTVGRLGKEDPSEWEIMVRALEDILANTSPGIDIVGVSYLQIRVMDIFLHSCGSSNISIQQLLRKRSICRKARAMRIRVKCSESWRQGFRRMTCPR